MTDRARKLGRRRGGRHTTTGLWFEELPFPTRARNVFDVGVVDLHQDGNLGVFTTNHNSRQGLMVNVGGGRFRDALDDLRLNHDLFFPSWEDDVNEPAMTVPGLYLYRRRNTVVVHHVAGDGDVVRGELVFSSAVAIGHQSGMTVQVSDDSSNGPSTSTVVGFTAQANATLELTPELVGIPLEVRLDDHVALSSVFVGPALTTPSSHVFCLHLRDRHGMAWAGYGTGGHLGVFVVRGGLKGRLDQFPGQVQDELLVNRGSGFVPVPVSGIEKRSCRGRSAAWVDLEGGGRLALFVSCQHAAPQLYRQRDDGTFADGAAELGLGDARGDAYAWIDVDGDGRVELVAATGNELTVYGREGGDRFVETQVVGLRNRGGWVNTLVVADYAGMGRPDIFAPSIEGNTLLVNHGGAYRALDPRTVGLPGKGGITANWVDYDNDGLVDLHVVPGGLFRQLPGGRFVATGLLDDELPRPIVDVRASWFDADNDGARDALIAVTTERRVKGGPFSWSTKLFRNVGTTGHWVQVELCGPATNPQAIGAAVTVTCGDRRVVQWVGCNDGSHYSQGHYRLYFGLGKAPAGSVEVRWPDGSVQELGRPAGDELVRMAYRSPPEPEGGR